MKLLMLISQSLTTNLRRRRLCVITEHNRRLGVKPTNWAAVSTQEDSRWAVIMGMKYVPFAVLCCDLHIAPCR
jgi:hypothetical protein